MVFLHAGGNFNPRTGTYALDAMIALVISGIIGRVLDRLMPRLIAREVQKGLTAQGEDRCESVSHRLESIARQKSQERSLSHRLPSRDLHAVSLGRAERQELSPSWDIAYLSLEDVPQELKPSRNRILAGKRGTSIHSGLLSADLEEQINTLEQMEQARERELFFRYCIRYWRIFHIALALVTVALTLWHIEYALALIIPAVQKCGFSYLLPWP
jgi:hypothetical protein